MSQILIDMHQQSHIVGIAEFDFTAVNALPVVGNYLDVNTEKLLALEPTHVLMMTGKAGTPPTLKSMADQFGFTLMAYPYPDTIADLQTIIRQMGIALKLLPQANDAIAKMQRQLDTLKAATAGLPSLRILPVIGTDPIMASGSKTIIDEMIYMVGSINVAHDAPVSAPVYDREKLITLAPDVIILLSPDSAPLAEGLTDARLQEFINLPVPAVKNQRFVLINDPLTFLPATTIPRIARQIALAIYPQLAETLPDER
jgi:ABC-type Fe3+-hydroxamate transport system substrate-binding protein